MTAPVSGAVEALARELDEADAGSPGETIVTLDIGTVIRAAALLRSQAADLARKDEEIAGLAAMVHAIRNERVEANRLLIAAEARIATLLREKGEAVERCRCATFCIEDTALTGRYCSLRHKAAIRAGEQG